MTLMGTLITLKKDKKSVAQNSDIRIEAIDPQGLKTTYYGVHTGHMGTQLRLKNMNTRLQVPMDKTPEWCERRQLWTHTG
jgi:hypothetical protein